jgi:hypothetical protein
MPVYVARLLLAAMSTEHPPSPQVANMVAQAIVNGLSPLPTTGPSGPTGPRGGIWKTCSL